MDVTALLLEGDNHVQLFLMTLYTSGAGVEEDLRGNTDIAVSTVSMASSSSLGATPSPSVPPLGTVHEGNPSLAPEQADLQEAEEGEEPTAEQQRKERREEKRLAIMMMSKKRKRLYDQIMKSRRKKAKEVRELKRKRREFDETQTISKKTKVV